MIKTPFREKRAQKAGDECKSALNAMENEGFHCQDCSFFISSAFKLKYPGAKMNFGRAVKLWRVGTSKSAFAPSEWMCFRRIGCVCLGKAKCHTAACVCSVRRAGFGWVESWRPNSVSRVSVECARNQSRPERQQSVCCRLCVGPFLRRAPRTPGLCVSAKLMPPSIICVGRESLVSSRGRRRAAQLWVVLESERQLIVRVLVVYGTIRDW